MRYAAASEFEIDANMVADMEGDIGLACGLETGESDVERVAGDRQRAERELAFCVSADAAPGACLGAGGGVSHDAREGTRDRFGVRGEPERHKRSEKFLPLREV